MLQCKKEMFVLIFVDGKNEHPSPEEPHGVILYLKNLVRQPFFRLLAHVAIFFFKFFLINKV